MSNYYPQQFNQANPPIPRSSVFRPVRKRLPADVLAAAGHGPSWQVDFKVTPLPAHGYAKCRGNAYHVIRVNGPLDTIHHTTDARQNVTENRSAPIADYGSAQAQIQSYATKF